MLRNDSYNSGSNNKVHDYIGENASAGKMQSLFVYPIT